MKVGRGRLPVHKRPVPFNSPRAMKVVVGFGSCWWFLEVEDYEGVVVFTPFMISHAHEING